MTDEERIGAVAAFSDSLGLSARDRAAAEDIARYVIRVARDGTASRARLMGLDDPGRVLRASVAVALQTLELTR